MSVTVVSDDRSPAAGPSGISLLPGSGSSGIPLPAEHMIVPVVPEDFGYHFMSGLYPRQANLPVNPPILIGGFRAEATRQANLPINPPIGGFRADQKKISVSPTESNLPFTLEATSVLEIVQAFDALPNPPISFEGQPDLRPAHDLYMKGTLSGITFIKR